jgi:hypothetical protein
MTLPEPKNPGELPTPAQPATNPIVFEVPETNINDEKNDVFSTGRSPFWAGDPVYDAALLFPDEPGVAPQAKTPGHSHQPRAPRDEKIKSAEMPNTAVCSYDGVEYVIAEGHTCVPGALPGTVVKLESNPDVWAIVLKATPQNVTYFKIPKNAVEVVGATPQA